MDRHGARGTVLPARVASAAQRAAGGPAHDPGGRGPRRGRTTHEARSAPGAPQGTSALVGILKPGHALVLGALVAGAPAWATDWELALDLRAVSSDGRESFL